MHLWWSVHPPARWVERCPAGALRVCINPLSWGTCANVTTSRTSGRVGRRPMWQDRAGTGSGCPAAAAGARPAAVVAAAAAGSSDAPAAGSPLTAACRWPYPAKRSSLRSSAAPHQRARVVTSRIVRIFNFAAAQATGPRLGEAPGADQAFPATIDMALASSAVDVTPPELGWTCG